MQTENRRWVNAVPSFNPCIRTTGKESRVHCVMCISWHRAKADWPHCISASWPETKRWLKCFTRSKQAPAYLTR